MQENQFLEVALRAVKKAEPIFLKYFGDARGVSIKEGIRPSLVSDADKEIEQIISAEIKTRFPTHAIVGEESEPSAGDSQYTWYIDPIDGTTNFIRGFSPCVISVGLFDERGPLVGIMASPQNGILYHAVRGEGAFKNGKKISVSNSSSFNMLVGGFCWRGTDNGVELLKKLSTVTRTLRAFGSVSMQLAMVAEGMIDCCVVTQTSLYDVASGLLLVSEAGGEVTDWSGQPFTKNDQPIVASNGVFHNSLLKVLS